jgi:hypothetical protein
MTVMDDYLDSPMDSEDVFPCKGCGEVGSDPSFLIRSACAPILTLLPIYLDPRGGQGLRIGYAFFLRTSTMQLYCHRAVAPRRAPVVVGCMAASRCVCGHRERNDQRSSKTRNKTRNACCVLTLLQPETDGISIASDATPATPSSIPMRTCSSSATAR